MQTKKQLMRYSRLKKENENRAETLARMKAAAQFTPSVEPDGSQHTSGDGQRMARAVENYLEYEEQMRPLMEKNRAEMLRIEQAVDALPDPLEREVLRLRYLDGDAWRLPKWREVACKFLELSSGQAARYDVILKGLSLEDLQHLRDGEIGLTQAYQLACKKQPTPKAEKKKDSSRYQAMRKMKPEALAQFLWEHVEEIEEMSKAELLEWIRGEFGGD